MIHKSCQINGSVLTISLTSQLLIIYTTKCQLYKTGYILAFIWYPTGSIEHLAAEI